jgi:Uma2 family endonuclease
LQQKKEVYQKYGVKEYTIIDPIAQNADPDTMKDGVMLFNKEHKKMSS